MIRDNVHTSTLFRQLVKTPDFCKFAKENEDCLAEIPFPDYLSSLCQKQQLVPERVIKASQIDRTYGHQLFNGTRKPSRDKILQLAFGFHLTVEEAQRMLRFGGKSPLYPRIMRDAAILYCLSRGMNVFEAQDLLESLGLTLLGGDYRHGE